MSTPTSIALRREPGPLVRSLVALSLRVGLGLILVMAGLSKFEDIRAGKYPGWMLQRFENTPLKPELVRLFAQVVPYGEVGVGSALICGLFTTLSATLSAALLTSFLFGHALLHKAEMYPVMLTYLLVNAGILWLSPVTSNYLSVDGLLFGWFWAPRSEGTYQAEPVDKPAAARK
jgi:uncharacterized membrane protein YphA (DoxX/SURF4 family)